MNPARIVVTLVVVAGLLCACGAPATPLAADQPVPEVPTRAVPSDTPPPTAAPTAAVDTPTQEPLDPTATRTPRLTPTPAAPGYEIAYSSQMTGELKLFDLNTGRVSVLAENHAMWTPRCWDWSPDGTRLLYADDQEVNGEWVSPLTVLHLESGERTVLSYKDTCAKWHPNSRVIVVVTYDDSSNPFLSTKRHHFVDAVQGSEITEIASRNYGSFSFSPDGKWIVFNSMSSNNQLHFIPIELDLTGQVTRVGLVTSIAADIGNRYVSAPFWSPTGDRIAFVAVNNIHYEDADIFALTLKRDHRGEISLDRPAAQNLTNGFTQTNQLRYQDLYWSPRGDRIAFWTYTPEPLSQDTWTLVKPRVFVLPLDGAGIIEITDSAYPFGQTPDWSPDGKKLIFSAGDQYAFTIVMCNPDGSQKQALSIESSGYNATFRPNPQLSIEAAAAPDVSQPEEPAAAPTDTAVQVAATSTPRLRAAQMTRLQISAPTAQRAMGAVYDSARQVIVLFGGTDQNNRILDETWEFDGSDWKKINTPTKPPARFWQGMAYDTDRKVVVMFGGNGNHDGQLLADTWEYDGRDWKQVRTANRPVETGFGPGMAYDSCRKKTVLFGGRSRMSDSLPSTWEYDGKDWVNVQPRGRPEARTLTAMVFDTQRCRAVLFGGMQPNVVGYQDTWEYDGQTWRERKTATLPPARWAHAMTYDPASGRILLYGGFGPQHPNGKALRDTWVFTGENWEQVTLASNFAVEQHVLVFDEQSRAAIAYGIGETWKINPGSAMVAPEAPAATAAANCALGYTRLAVGKNAQPAGAITLANNIRSAPKIADNIIGSFTPGMFVKIVDGPVCADGYVFWKVESRFIPGGAGWTAEGDGKQYFLEPLE